MSQKTRKPEQLCRIRLRVPVATLALIDRAAALEGVSPSDFVMESARLRALKVLGDGRVFSLGPQESAAFVEALEDPPVPSNALRSLMRSKPPWTDNDEA